MLRDSRQWIEDIDRVLLQFPEIKLLSGKTVLVSGATGLIGSAIVEVFLRFNEKHKEKIKMVIAGRSKEKIEGQIGILLPAKEIEFWKFDASDPFGTPDMKVDYIVHAASNADPRKIMEEPVETILDNVIGLKHLLEIAKKDKAERLVYVSSSEVYGIITESKPLKVDRYGMINHLEPRSSYAVGKKAGESLCVAYAKEYGVDSIIVRPGHIYGPTASPKDSRVSSAWVFDAVSGKDIVMKSSGEQRRSYCYCLDCASAIIKILLSTDVEENVFNISNPASIITIRQMAEIITREAEVTLRIDEPSQLEKKQFNPMLNSSLDSTELEKIGWRGLFDAEEGIEHTIAILKEIANV
ncbi:MAG: NAD-dependent epimerase/dehydratase family protein [Oscillospiraceae bacterium]|nr:NAD-dependent epimerase/dehydratase family protein [Oscillospiraceae bacterium]